MLLSILRVNHSSTLLTRGLSPSLFIAAYNSKPKKPDPKEKHNSKKPSNDQDPASSSSFSVLAFSDNELPQNDAASRARLLVQDEQNPSLDVGPNGRPLFTATPSLSQLTQNDACSYFKLRSEPCHFSFSFLLSKPKRSW